MVRRRAAKTDSCLGKTHFRKFTRAEAAARKSARINNEPMHAYHCQYCNRFHVGAHHKLRKPEVSDDAEA